jgi:hypothetical protein
MAAIGKLPFAVKRLPFAAWLEIVSWWRQSVSGSSGYHLRPMAYELTPGGSW